MVDLIVTALVVLAYFVATALLLALFVWRTDPYQFSMWMRSLRARRERRQAATPNALRPAAPPQWRLRAKRVARVSTRVVTRPVQRAARVRPTVADDRVAARLEYWLALENLERRKRT